MERLIKESELDGLIFKHRSHNTEYLIKKRKNLNGHSVTWEKQSGISQLGSTSVYSNRNIIENIKNGEWVVVSLKANQKDDYKMY